MGLCDVVKLMADVPENGNQFFEHLHLLSGSEGTGRTRQEEEFRPSSMTERRSPHEMAGAESGFEEA